MSIEEFEDYTRDKMEEDRGKEIWPKLDIYKVLMAFYGDKTQHWVFTVEDDLTISSCPLCGARKASKFKNRKATLWPFVMNTEKGIFLCHCCERGGDGYTLIAEAENCSQLEAAQHGLPYIKEEE